jgi:hypothetical protein
MFNGDTRAIQSSQQPPTGDRNAGAMFDLSSFFPKDNSTTLGQINRAMAGGDSAFAAQKALPSVEPPPQNQLTKSDTNFDPRTILLANNASSDKQEEAMRVFDGI